jgi:outer membrane lipoprotein SlyB
VFATRNIVSPLKKTVVSGINGAAVGGMAGNLLAGAEALAFTLKTWNHVD